MPTCYWQDLVDGGVYLVNNEGNDVGLDIKSNQQVMFWDLADRTKTFNPDQEKEIEDFFLNVWLPENSAV